MPRLQQEPVKLGIIGSHINYPFLDYFQSGMLKSIDLQYDHLQARAY